VVLYKPVDPGAPPQAQREFSSPVGRLHMDRVELLATAKVAFEARKYKMPVAPQQPAKVQIEGTYWTMEAAVPWAALGAQPPVVGPKLCGDFGYLESDENGTQTIGRKYWSGKTQTVICDLPSEARLNPSLWGRLEVVKEEGKLKLALAKKSLEPEDLTRPASGGVDDLRLEP